MLRNLKDNEKIVLAFQRVRVNERGENEDVQDLYEVIGNNTGFQLVKCNNT